ncbi:hypothetical protein I316_02847 [Kwoniella heveanensis BCC8398]|uniref:Uncharacterized protein n=1 Tax=Kwoniella heveanensis BCC8398 TaxID=1296120 RepID=A0A1B9GWA3_9TREE|nr:hypothetical protein I316_02847 [Kwoniella heveanensis BCC8398]
MANTSEQQSNGGRSTTATASNGAASAAPSNTWAITSRTFTHGDSRSGFVVTDDQGIQVRAPVWSAASHANDTPEAAADTQQSSPSAQTQASQADGTATHEGWHGYA